MPKRIQRKRTKGWRMPPNAIYVGRGTRWGNPFTVERYGLKDAVDLFRKHLKSFFEYLDTIPNGAQIREHYLNPLRGKDLACWCKEDSPCCHADVWMELEQHNKN